MLALKSVLRGAAILLAGCAIALGSGPRPAAAQPLVNLTTDCVTGFNPDLDVNYFPDQVTVEHAGFSVEYFDHYKVVTVERPWPGATEPFVYVLVQCGTPAPDGYDAAQIVEVPVRTAVSLSASYIPHFDALGVADHVIAVDNADYIYNAAIRERIEAGEVAPIGGGSTINVELALDLAPDVIFTYGSGFPEYDAHPVLAEAGLFTALSADFNETTPLGRAEWLKFTALFFNAEADANRLYDRISADYTRLAGAVAARVTAAERPSVLINAMFSGTWFVSGGASYAARLIADAGGAYVFADDTSTGGIPFSFEEVLDRAQDADVWLNPNVWTTLADGLAEDERYAEFAAFEAGAVYNNNARSLPAGANDYFEYGGLRVDYVLADLIRIFHPELAAELLPSAPELIFYQRLR